jgi:hypothetical protein
VDLMIDGRRVRYRLGPPVDSSGQFADGAAFSGFREFRDTLAAQPRRLAYALTTKLLTFATGREMGFSDRAEIQRIVDDAADSDYGVRTLIHGVVNSSVFLNK